MKLISPNCSDLFAPNIEIGKFPDGDSHIRIPNPPEINDQPATLYYRLYPDQNNSLVELLLILESLKQQRAKVTLVVPYLPYARQDKKTLDGEIQSAKIVCNLLAQAGCEKLVTFDCHFLNELGLTKYGQLSIHNISMNDLLIAEARKFFGGHEFEVVGPDAGAAYLVKDVGGKVMKKSRKSYENNVIAYRHVEDLTCEFDVKDKNVLLLDDMISTGSTMIRALEKMKFCGAKEICCAATHGLFLYNCVDKIRKLTDFVFASDTIVSTLSTVSIKSKLEDLEPTAPQLF